MGKYSTERCGVILLWVFCVWHIKFVFGARSGPYHTSVTRVNRCANPTQPVDKNPAMMLFIEEYNKTDSTILRGNVSVYRDNVMKKMTAKSYIWQNNKWIVQHVINNTGCNKVFLPAICLAAGVKYDPKTCNFKKGQYVFENLNVNKLHHVWMSSQTYGKILWRMEVFSITGTLYCHEFETLVAPVK